MAVNEWIEEQDQNISLEGVKKLEQRWESCVALQGSYVEKLWNDFDASQFLACFSHYLLNARRIYMEFVGIHHKLRKQSLFNLNVNWYFVFKYFKKVSFTTLVVNIVRCLGGIMLIIASTACKPHSWDHVWRIFRERPLNSMRPLLPTDACLPFTLHRWQFPLRPAFAMTIKKAQGKTLQCVWVLLDKPVFTHVNCTLHNCAVVISGTSDSE